MVIRIIFIVLIWLVIGAFPFGFLLDNSCNDTELYNSLPEWYPACVIIFRRDSELNIVGKIFLFIVTLPCCVLVDAISGIFFLLTWHPLKKDAE